MLRNHAVQNVLGDIVMALLVFTAGTVWVFYTFGIDNRLVIIDYGNISMAAFTIWIHLDTRRIRNRAQRNPVHA